MKKKLVALILIGSMALSFTACGNSSDSSKGTKEASKKTEASAETPKEEAKEEVKDPVVLTGKWEYKDDDGTWMQADITEDTITINWIMDEGNTTAVTGLEPILLLQNILKNILGHLPETKKQPIPLFSPLWTIQKSFLIPIQASRLPIR